MSAGWCCDRCGAAIFEEERTQLLIDLNRPKVRYVSVNNPIDLCLKCGDSVENILRTRIVTKGSRMEIIMAGPEVLTDDAR